MRVSALLVSGIGLAAVLTAPDVMRAEEEPLPEAELVTEPAFGGVEVSAPALPTLSSSAEIEQAIAALSDPGANEQVDQILTSILSLQDMDEQMRLQMLFNERLQAISGSTEAAPEAAPEVGLVPPPQLSYEEILVRIQMLNLGPEASADDLRARDELVYSIVAIEDPMKRHELLLQLEEKERQSDTAIYRPAPESQEQ